ncbi:MAG: antitoxin family protein [Defluviitaleaceae bacterium]|nr:antitoxin family protein [Defluviitaleaceae bacterium]
MQAIKAYYSEGTFVPFEPVVIPKGSHAIVTILDFAINQAQITDDFSQDDEDFSAWHKRMKEALALSMDEALPEIYFTRSKDMRPPLNFDN